MVINPMKRKYSSSSVSIPSKRRSSYSSSGNTSSSKSMFTPTRLLNATLAVAPPSIKPYIAAGKLAYNGYKAYKRSTGSVKASAERKHGKWGGVSTGRYKGKFRKPRAVKTSILSESLQKGFAETSEFFGRIEDPDTVYIGHSTRDIQAYANTLSAAFIRMLFKKAGYNIANRLEELNLSQWDSSAGFKLEFVIQNAHAAGTALGPGTSSYETVDNLTLTQIAQNFNGFNSWMNTYIQNNDGNNNTQVPHKLILYCLDKDQAVSNWRMLSQIDLSHQKVTFHAKSTLVIQNRTSAAGATTGDKAADRVDNQPLCGKMYEFNQATPRLGQNHTSIQQLQAIPRLGTLLIRAAEMTDNGLQNSPHPRMWTNCTKVSNIILQPGEMKQNTITHTFSGRLITVLNRMKAQGYFATDQEAWGGAGKFMLIQLEEKLRTPSANPVTVQYERKIELMCFSKPTKAPALTQTLAVLEINRLP